MHIVFLVWFCFFKAVALLQQKMLSKTSTLFQKVRHDIMQIHFYILFTGKQFKLFRCNLNFHRFLLLTHELNLNSVKVALVKDSSAN